jgi:hypothetical protein
MTNYGAGTQRKIILELLLSGFVLDWRGCLNMAGSSKASTRIGEIERATELPIKREWKEKGGVRFMTYWLDFKSMTESQRKKYIKQK